MGAHWFETLVAGKDLDDAIRKAREKDLHEYGHDPYTGTMGQKTSAVEITSVKMPRARTEVRTTWKGEDESFTRPPQSVLIGMIYEALHATWSEDDKARARHRKTLAKYVPEHQIDRMFSVMDDKWGPVAAIQLTGKTLTDAKKRLGVDGTRQKVWQVMGTAAS